MKIISSFKARVIRVVKTFVGEKQSSNNADEKEEKLPVSDEPAKWFVVKYRVFDPRTPEKTDAVITVEVEASTPEEADYFADSCYFYHGNRFVEYETLEVREKAKNK